MRVLGIFIRAVMMHIACSSVHEPAPSGCAARLQETPTTHLYDSHAILHTAYLFTCASDGAPAWVACNEKLVDALPLHIYGCYSGKQRAPPEPERGSLQMQRRHQPINHCCHAVSTCFLLFSFLLKRKRCTASQPLLEPAHKCAASARRRPLSRQAGGCTTLFACGGVARTLRVSHFLLHFRCRGAQRRQAVQPASVHATSGDRQQWRCSCCVPGSGLTSGLIPARS